MTDQKHPQDQIEVGENLRRSAERATMTAPIMKEGKMISAEIGTSFYDPTSDFRGGRSGGGRRSYSYYPRPKPARKTKPATPAPVAAAPPAPTAATSAPTAAPVEAGPAQTHRQLMQQV